jgi:hypothetical protein
MLSIDAKWYFLAVSYFLRSRLYVRLPGIIARTIQRGLGDSYQVIIFASIYGSQGKSQKRATD